MVFGSRANVTRTRGRKKAKHVREKLDSGNDTASWFLGMQEAQIPAGTLCFGALASLRTDTPCYDVCEEQFGRVNQKSSTQVGVEVEQSP